jgi:putative endonuclease
MKQLNFQKGKFGETIAKDFLLKKGYKIISQNFQNRFGEIDLIAADGQVLVFVEVKSKVGQNFGSPEEMINQRKIQQIKNQALVFLQQNPRISAQYPQQRIDAVCIVLNENDYSVKSINHYQNITG